MFDRNASARVVSAYRDWACSLVSLRTGTQGAAKVALDLPDASSSPIHWLCLRLGLSESARAALWLLTICEIDDEVAALVRSRTGADTCAFTVSALRQTLGMIHRTPAPQDLELMSSFDLIEMDEDARVSQTRRRLRATDRVVELAMGELRLDARIALLATITKPTVQIEAPASLISAIEAKGLVIAVGAVGAGRRTILTAAAAAVCEGTLVVEARRLETEPTELRRQLRAIVRECCLFNVAPVLADIHVLSEDHRWPVVESELLDAFEGPVLATSDKHRTFTTTRTIMHVDVVLPGFEDRRKIWETSLSTNDGALLDTVAAYALTPGMISTCARTIAATAAGDAVTHQHVRDALRTAFDSQLTTTARRVTVSQTWDDLVLPPDQFDQIVEFVARVKHRGLVLDSWGFGSKTGKGNGLAALFSGPPGTGKTMAAGLIAEELQLDLYQADLSKIVSKYIGETEKALGALFDAAESGHAIILFDEADSLFAKRSEVKSSNDRYANLEVNYLLQRLESFKGLCILTTNHETAIDEAFRRRLAIHVRFPVPDESQREQLWRSMIPSRALVESDLDFEPLARDFAMSGGYIKNAALRAAYLAAHEGTAISTGHFERAARIEYEAMGKLTYELSS